MTSIPYPLTPANRLKLAVAFRQVRRVDISVDSAIEGQMGAAFVDDPSSPQIFQLRQSDFFCYFLHIYFNGYVSKDTVMM